VVAGAGRRVDLPTAGSTSRAAGDAPAAGPTCSAAPSLPTVSCRAAMATASPPRSGGQKHWDTPCSMRTARCRSYIAGGAGHGRRDVPITWPAAALRRRLTASWRSREYPRASIRGGPGDRATGSDQPRGRFTSIANRGPYGANCANADEDNGSALGAMTLDVADDHGLGDDGRGEEMESSDVGMTGAAEPVQD
jgi:hypothetical protein